jgi:hypothetical protein
MVELITWILLDFTTLKPDEKKKVNVYLPSLMMKVPNHLYVLGDTYEWYA